MLPTTPTSRSRTSSPRRLLALAVASAALAVIAAGCGSGSPSGAAATGPAYGTSQSPSKAAAPSVSTRRTKLGTVLVDGRGRTLYLFEKDNGTASSCYGACASVWPPLTTGGKAVAGNHVAAARLGTTRRTDGTLGVTYDGHPLYTYAADAKPGDLNGQGLDQFGAEWYVLAPNGSKIDNG